MQVHELLYQGNSNEPENANLKSNDDNFLDRLIIKIDCPWKGMFDNMMLVVSTYNTFSQAYYAAFGSTDQVTAYLVLEFIIEVLFTLDFIFCFCQEYKDEESCRIVT